MSKDVSEVVGGIPCTLVEIFHYIRDNGDVMKKETWNGSSPLMQLFRDDFHDRLCLILNKISSKTYKVICRTGSSGRWCTIPYTAMLCKEYNQGLNTVTASKGMYPIYLVSPDNKVVYLAYMMGVGTRYERKLINVVRNVRSVMNLPGFETDISKIDLKPDKNHYSSAIFWYKKYYLNEELSEKVLEDDLRQLVSFHESNGPKIFQIIQELG